MYHSTQQKSALAQEAEYATRWAEEAELISEEKGSGQQLDQEGSGDGEEEVVYGGRVGGFRAAGAETKTATVEQANC